MKAMKRWAGCDLWKAVETLDVIEFYESITKAGQVSVVNIMSWDDRIGQSLVERPIDWRILLQNAYFYYFGQFCVFL